MRQPNTLQFPESKTIDEVIQNLDVIIEQSVNENNYLCAFAYVYQRTTREIKKALVDGRFENPERMEKMDVIFANLYIQAYHNYKIKKPISDTWRFAFDLKNNTLPIIQHILLGMNTHINLDLSVAAAAVSTGKQIISLKKDFMMVSKILGELTNTIQHGLGKASITMKLLDIFGFKSDEKIINFSIKKARYFAWINALELSLLDGNAKKLRIEEIDKRVVDLSKIISKPPGRFLRATLRLISKFESKDMRKVIEKLSAE